MRQLKCVLPDQISLKFVVFFAASFLHALFGGLTLVFKKDIFQAILESQLTVKEGTEAYKAWKETPIPVYNKFYLYSIINPHDFLVNHAKPILEQKGPYVFRNKEEKVDLVWHKNHTISYKRKKFWWFEPEMSAGPLTDTVLTLNMPMIGAAEASRENFFMQWGLADVFSSMEAELFINKTIGELLFDGYDDELIAIGDANTDEEDKVVPMDKFAYFYKRNGTSWADGDISMHTGEDDISKLGQISTWNYRKSTDAFSGKCGQVRGSSDGLFAPGTLSMKDRFEIFSTDSCRTLSFQRDGFETVHGIHADRFVLSPDVFANKSVCADNHCYNNNLPSGVQNVTQCKMKSPAFLSRPHFHMADKFYPDQFQYGIKPLQEKHESFFLIEPMSSIPLQVTMRLQINVLLDKNEGINYIFNDLPRVFYPVMWFDSEARLPEHMAGPLKMLVNLPFIMQTCGILGIVLGLLGMALSLYCLLRKKTQKSHGISGCEYARVAVKTSALEQQQDTPLNPIIRAVKK